MHKTVLSLFDSNDGGDGDRDGLQFAASVNYWDVTACFLVLLLEVPLNTTETS